MSQMRFVHNFMIFYWEVLKKSVARFVGKDMPMHAAALSYYTMFSLPSMLLIILWTAARFYKEIAVRQAIFAEIGSLVGEEGAHQIMATLEKLNVQEPTFWGTAIGLAVLLFFATTVFDAMRTALNQIVQAKSADSVGMGIWRLFRIRFVAFAMLVSISFILLVSLVLDSLITALGHYLAQWIGGLATYLMALDYFLLDLGSTTVLFALYFKYLPDRKLEWGEVWFAALLTAALIAVGKSLIGFFIGNSEVADLYDAAGSLLVVMLWVYYAAAIFLFGASFAFERAELLNNRPAEVELTV